MTYKEASILLNTLIHTEDNNLTWREIAAIQLAIEVLNEKERIEDDGR